MYQKVTQNLILASLARPKLPPSLRALGLAHQKPNNHSLRSILQARACSIIVLPGEFLDAFWRPRAARVYLLARGLAGVFPPTPQADASHVGPGCCLYRKPIFNANALLWGRLHWRYRQYYRQKAKIKEGSLFPT